jgi:hypothetical protein
MIAAESIREVARALGRVCAIGIVYALGLVLVPGLRVMPAAVGALPAAAPPGSAPSTAATSAARDPSRFLLNALLVPALDGDAVPLRWVDPRPALQCGPGTEVRVNGAPLAPGTLVPDAPFKLEWQADGCRPFGAHGPRFEGRVRLTLFREDWGFSAMVAPADLRIESAQNQIALIQPGAATLPQCVDPDELTLDADGPCP